MIDDIDYKANYEHLALMEKDWRARMTILKRENENLRALVRHYREQAQHSKEQK